MSTDRESCEAIRPLLVDYCDGQLRQDQRETVEAHLEHCGACRSEVAALRRSLILAQQVWREAQTESSLRGRRHRLRLAGGVAIAAGLLLAAGLILRGWPGESPHSPVPVESTAHELPVPPQTDGDGSAVEISMADVLRMIEREETAARQAKSAILLARYPEVRCEAVAALHRISLDYPDTAAGKALKRPTVNSEGVQP